MSKFGLFAMKKEMTKLWVDGAYVPVTLLQVPEQEVVRYKTEEKDGYSALVLGLNKKESDAKKGSKISYSTVAEFRVDQDFVDTNPVGSLLTAQLLDDVSSVAISGYGRGKWFQWWMKRFHLKWGNKTRGSKFHRQIGSMGNRKPRRTLKGHPHAGRMGNEHVTLKNRALLEKIDHDGQLFVAVKGSVPGSYNSLIKVIVS